MTTQNQDEIMELVGADTWEEVVNEYSDMAVWRIENNLDELFTEDDNHELAGRIYNELN